MSLACRATSRARSTWQFLLSSLLVLWLLDVGAHGFDENRNDNVCRPDYPASFFSFVLMISARSVCPEHSLVLNVLTIYPADIGVRTPAVTNKTFHSTVKTMFTTPFLLPSYMSSLVLGVNQ